MVFYSKNQRNIVLQLLFRRDSIGVKYKLVRNSVKKTSIIKSDSDTIPV
jgi:hypothetical protein